MRMFGALGGLCVVGFLAGSTAWAAGAASPFKTRLLKAAGGEPTIEATFELPSLYTNKAEHGFTEVKVDGLNPIHEAGAPDLPTTGMMITIPDGYEPRLTVVNATRRTVDGVNVRPFRIKSRCAAPESLNFEAKSEIYESEGLWPQQNVRFEYLGVMQGVRLARLAVYPVQFDAKNQALELTTSLDVKVEFVPTESDKARVDIRSVSPALLQVLRDTTVNAGSSPSLRAAVAPERMLIVTADRHKTDLDALVAWKRSRGMIVDIVTFTEAGGNREAVKAYVQAYYDRLNPKPTYLLLVGNGTTMPPFRRSTSSGSAASDYPFALLAGNDIVPDIIVGRLLADDSAQLQVQVAKWLAHERTPDTTDGSWYEKGTTIASSEGSGPSDVEYAEMIQNTLLGATYSDMDKFYEGQGTATATNIVNALSQGRSWLTYIGHGSGTSWGSTNTTFSTSTIRTMTNSKLPVIVDVACDNGSFVDIANCFGKTWVTHTASGRGAGAVGYYGASVSTSWDPPAVMAVGVAKRHFERNIVSLGGSLLAGQIYLMEQMGTGSDVVDNFEWYNLLGDPSLTMRTANPSAFDMDWNMVESEEANEFKVTVSNTDGSVRAGVSVALLSADGYTLFGYGVSDAQGKVSFALPSDSSLSGAKLTGGGYNLVTREVVIQ